MAIKGLTDRGLAFPEIGRVRKGDTGGKNGAPRDLTYFRVEFDSKETEASAIFAKKYGEKPTEINVILPFNEIERCWDAHLEAYTAGRMVARGDGEKYLYLVDTKTGAVLVKNGEPYRAYKEGEVLGTWTNSKTGKVESIRCKPAGRLKVIIPELGRAAFLTVLTGSIHDVINLSDQLRAFAAVNGGRIAGIPFILRRRPRKISTPKPDGSRARYEKWLLSIEADPEWVRRMLMETKRLALPGNGLALLPAPAGHADEHAIETPALAGEIVDDDDEQDPPANPEPYDVGPDFDVHDTYPPADDLPPEEAPHRTAQVTDEAKAQPPAPPAHIQPPPRPFTALQLKANILATSRKHAGKTASEAQLSLTAYVLGLCFAGDKAAEAKRHSVQKYLTGHDSLKAMPGEYALALLDWLKPTKDSGGEYAPHPMAVKEAGLVLRQALQDAGQQELPLS